ncbi:hypothetical protein EKH77_26715 [Streptomyces luteoverticillatus]|uniref:Exo-alpha-sialidase n=1 Tax=Streptomyces luteoverticillatus TaxID=66425 RepID=A0A3Q9FXV4_STRLT|nr:hypothetical protein EKH77_26715 [Streptomyces luteoverticillatus]
MTRQRGRDPGTAQMTMRVSLDSGRTWGPTRYVRAAKTVEDDPLRFPRCECSHSPGHRCSAARELASMTGGHS